jgi:PQQ-dependent dehydrogenase (methanol/ethanol family)
VPREWGKNACCDVVNRGVAVWGDKVYVGTIDGRLVALEAATGKPVWDVLTIDPRWPYTITGAPRVVKGNVIIGNGGAEYGVRGYVTAYDAQTGAQAWRFYTVPGDPAKGFESPALERAAATWNGEWWKYGGGGTAWDSMAYDPTLDLLYIGVGNGAPWNRNIRSPKGGDNLFLSSIVAIRPATGEYVWHYQTTPGDTWDYTATQHIMLLDLAIGGKPRKVLVQAPKNGFFYVIDRTNGKLISAQAYVPLNWATHVDLKTGRPVETPNARYTDPTKPELIFPSPFGGHNWHPMAYSPKTGLVYLPAQEMPFVFKHDTAFRFTRGEWNLGTEFKYASLPEDPKEIAKILPLLKGRLLAWDPVANKEVFRIDHPGPWNGGILATAGNLIFQGTPGGEFAAYRADNGKRLWSAQAQTGVVSGPVTYRVDDRQYVAVTVGWGTVFGMIAPGAQRPRSRVLVYALGGSAALPPLQVAAEKWPELLPVTGTAAQIAQGKDVYLTRCFMCHGDAAMSAGVLPDLRLTPKEKHQAWNAIVLDGTLARRGMPGFGNLLSPADAAAVQQYVLQRAHATRPPN